VEQKDTFRINRSINAKLTNALLNAWSSKQQDIASKKFSFSKKGQSEELMETVTKYSTANFWWLQARAYATIDR
jgi:hypothetical protein